MCCLGGGYGAVVRKGGVLYVKPAAFMSYVRFDDEHEGGQLTQFQERLSAEVRIQTGEAFPIFQDRNDIAWGQSWQARINEALDAVTLLIPIITPSFFRSPPCRDELTKFLGRERQLGRQDLILPVYYVSAPELDDPVRREADELARVLATRQYTDWRELRFEPFTSPVVRRAFAQLASRLRDSFWRTTGAPPAGSGPPSGRAVAEAPSSRATAAASSAVGKSITAKQEPPTRVVDAYGRGDHTTIGAAVRAAKPGDRILIRPGLYEEGVVLNKPLELLGDGSVQDIVIQATGKDALLFQANIGRVANVTMRQLGGDGPWYGVDIAQGRLELEGCDISSQNYSGVAIRNGADPRVRRNRIHHSKEAGVLIYKGGLGTLEDNDIANNGMYGVEVKFSGNPTLRRNQIHHNMEDGIYIHNDGLGMVEDNDIIENEISGIDIRSGGRSVLRNNRINRNRGHAVKVATKGYGIIEDNDLRNNDKGPWNIVKSSTKNVTRIRNQE
jgi:F-box protein 11